MSSGPGRPGRVARAATRYRPGKAPVAAAGDTYSSDDDSDGQDEDDYNREAVRRKRRKESQGDELITDISSGTAALKNNQRRTAGVVIQQQQQGSSSRNTTAARKPIVKLDDVRIGASKEKEAAGSGGGSSDEYETDTDEEVEGTARAKPVFKKPGLSTTTTTTTKESSSEYETDSEEGEGGEEEEESSEEDSRPAMLKPIFISKKQRESLRQGGQVGEEKAHESADSKSNGVAPTDNPEEITDESIEKARHMAEERRKQSHLLAAETIKREMAEREHEEGQPDLSDTDGKDPEEEFQSWRIRELSRLKEEREAMKAKEEEREQVERRRAMPEAQRLAEDTKRAEESREAKRKARQEEGKTGSFMQKYHHKGSFFADDELLKNRDAMAKTESAVDMSSLPKVMQVRDYGKAGRSKWTHLANEDTSRSQQDHRMKGISGAAGAGGGGQRNNDGKQTTCFACGGPHLRRDCPQQQRNDGQQRGGEARGANSVPVRDRDRGSHPSSREHRRSRSPVDRRRREQYSSNSSDRRREDRY